MSIKALKTGLFSIAMLLGAVAANAATLTPNGVVLVNSGNGFVQVTGPVEVAQGDMVMVNEGSAQMSFPDGSLTSMQPGQVYTVGTVGAAPAGGAAAAAGAGGGLSTTALVVGGVVVAGGAAAAIAASNSNKKSSSP